jgi:tetratricopeptide (TPR) repeat protein
VALAVMLALWPGLAWAASKWLVVESKNFRIYSDGPQEEVEHLALKLERFRRVVALLYKVNLGQRSYAVVAFHDTYTFARFRPYLGPESVVLGYNLNNGVEDMAALALYNHGFAEEGVLFHECFHVLAEARENGWPVWLDEGSAEVFSTFEERGDKAVVGIPKGEHVKMLRDCGLMRMDDLLTTKLRNYAEFRIFYPQAWALTHYLIFADHRAHLDQLVEFTHLLRGGMDDVSAFRKAFGVTPEALEKNLGRYIRNEQYPAWEIPVANLGVESALATRVISEGDRDCIFGNLVLSRLDVNRAEYYFKSALARDPGIVCAYEGLGFVAGQRHHYAEARQRLEQALTRGTNNYRTYYFYALVLYLDRAGGHQFADSVPRETALAMAEALKKCIALRPSFPQTYELLARLSLNPGEDPAEGMKLIKVALQFQPSNKWFLLTAAKLQMRLHDYETARKTLESLLGKDVGNGELKEEAHAAQGELDALINAHLK